MRTLETQGKGAGGEIQLTDALEELARADGLEASERELLDWLDEIWAD